MRQRQKERSRYSRPWYSSSVADFAGIGSIIANFDHHARKISRRRLIHMRFDNILFVALKSGVFHPILKFIQRNLLGITRMLPRLRLFGPSGKLFLGNFSSFDPSKVPLIFPAVLAAHDVLFTVLSPLLYWSNVPAELPGWLRPAAILRSNSPNDRKVSAAAPAPADWNVFCNTVPQCKINQVSNIVRIQNCSTGVLAYWSKANWDGFETKQVWIVRLVK